MNFRKQHKKQQSAYKLEIHRDDVIYKYHVENFTDTPNKIMEKYVEHNTYNSILKLESYIGDIVGFSNITHESPEIIIFIYLTLADRYMAISSSFASSQTVEDAKRIGHIRQRIKEKTNHCWEKSNETERKTTGKNDKKD